MQEFN